MNTKYLFKSITLFTIFCLFLSSCMFSSSRSDSSIKNNGTNSSAAEPPIPNTETESTDANVTNSSSIVAKKVPILPNSTQAPRKVIVPNLPSIASSPEEFTSSGWTLLDKVELDYNNDGKNDFIGVLEHKNISDDTSFYPRILFAAVNMGNGSYKLDFQDINLIHAPFEGGAPFQYEPMAATNNSFTINSYSEGGNSHSYARESTTFKYMNGGWYMVSKESSMGSKYKARYYQYDDYESGKGFRGHNYDDTPDDFQNVILPRNYDYDLSFYIDIGPPISLEVASERLFLSSSRLGVITLSKITIANGIVLNASDVKTTIDGSQYTMSYMDSNYVLYTDENYIVFAFQLKKDKIIEYLGVVDRKDNSARIIEQGTLTQWDAYSKFIGVKIYHDMIYFQDSVEDYDKIDNSITQLVRMNLDGDSREIVYNYNYYDENMVVPYNLSFEFANDGLVIRLFGDDERYYYVDFDGDNERFLGSVKGTASYWLGTSPQHLISSR